MRSLLGLVLVLAACGSPLSPVAAPQNPARVIAANTIAAGQSELTMEIQELI